MRMIDQTRKFEPRLFANYPFKYRPDGQSLKRQSFQERLDRGEFHAGCDGFDGGSVAERDTGCSPDGEAERVIEGGQKFVAGGEFREV